MFLTTLFVSSCDKEKDFNLDSAPPSANFQYLDFKDGLSLSTIAMPIYSTYDLSYNLSFPKYLVGAQSTELGNFKASTYFQIRLSTDNNDVGTNPIVDSAVMILRMSGAYRYNGDSTQKTTLVFNEIQEKIAKENYYSNSSIKVESVPFFKTDIIPNAKDTTLKFTLNGSSFPEKILVLGNANLSNNTNFLEKIYGIQISGDTSAGYSSTSPLVNLDLNDSRNEMVIYYRSSLGTGRTLKLGINNESRKFGNYFMQKQSFPDSINYSYVKGANQIQTIVNLQDSIVKLLKTVDLAVVQAKLTFKINQNLLKSFPIPRLLLFPINPEDKRFQLFSTFNKGSADDGFSIYGGVFNPKDSAYTFNLSLNLQTIAKKYRENPNYKFNGWVLIPTAQSPLTAREIALLKKSAKIELKYSKLN